MYGKVVLLLVKDIIFPSYAHYKVEQWQVSSHCPVIVTHLPLSSPNYGFKQDLWSVDEMEQADLDLVQFSPHFPMFHLSGCLSGMGLQVTKTVWKAILQTVMSMSISGTVCHLSLHLRVKDHIWSAAGNSKCCLNEWRSLSSGVQLEKVQPPLLLSINIPSGRKDVAPGNNKMNQHGNWAGLFGIQQLEAKSHCLGNQQGCLRASSLYNLEDKQEKL